MNLKYEGLRSALLDNEKLIGTSGYKSIPDLCEEYGVKPNVIHQLRFRLGIIGKHKNSADLPKKLSTTLLPDVRTAEGLMKVLEEEPVLSASDRLKILSRLIRTGAPAVKIAAIKTYEDLTRVTTERVGPPDPLTEDEQVTRLARLCMALGQPIVDRAREVAFGSPSEEVQPPEGEPAPTLQPYPEGVLADGEGPGGGVQDLPPPEEPSSGPRPQDGEDPGAAL